MYDENQEIRKECNGRRIHSNRQPYIFTDVHFALSSYNYAKYARIFFLYLKVFAIKEQQLIYQSYAAVFLYHIRQI